jgi:maltooligosyltrehalose trehalohydrolase
MTQFSVWAPDADKVGLSLQERTVPMKRQPSGWWHIEVDGLPAETDYAFVVDGSQPLPDPRSPWQPNGVHGPSRTVDHTAFAWQHDAWRPASLAEAVIYELHIGTFTPQGTFEAAIEKLDYLTGLGITHVEVMPVAEFSGERGWGYDGVDLYAPHHSYGRPDALKRLVDACHARGLAVLLDVVYNHLGPAGNYLERFGPYFTERYHTPWGKAINYDQAGSDEVRCFVVDNALMWLRDYRFDGLRLDAVHAILDQSAVHILEQMAAETRRLSAQTGRDYVLIAESDLNDPRLVRSVDLGGYGLDAAWSDDFHHALHALLTGERAGYYADFGTIEGLARAIRDVYVYDGRYSDYRRRSHGRPVGELPADRFVVAAQNHDQVGNRAKGERLEHLAGERRARIAAAVLLTAPSVPLVFQGQEWAASSPFQYFTAHEDPDLARAVSEGRKREFAAFGWQPGDVPDPQALETFERSRLDWDEVDREPHAAMLDWYRDLIELRDSVADLTNTDLRYVDVTFSGDEGWLKVRRGDVLLIVNLSDGRRSFEVASSSTLRLASDAAARFEDGRLQLPSDSVGIILGGGASVAVG